jgi:hypothetical protein
MFSRRKAVSGSAAVEGNRLQAVEIRQFFSFRRGPNGPHSGLEATPDPISRILNDLVSPKADARTNGRVPTSVP